MRDILTDLSDAMSGPEMSDPDPVRRAQIQMKRPLPKRFYKDVTVGESDDGHTILLDGRAVRTPARRPLAVPSGALAERLRDEWDGQGEEIDPAKMPVTRLVNTAIDGVADNRQAVLDEIVRFAGTDMICYRADSPERLVAIQQQAWDPVLEWAADAHGARFILAEGVIHQEQPQPAITAFGEALTGYGSPLELACIHTVTTLTGSAILALAFAHGFLDAETVWKLAHVDEDWQIEHWGTDEEAFRRRELRWQELQIAAAVFDDLGAR